MTISLEQFAVDLRTTGVSKVRADFRGASSEAERWGRRTQNTVRRTASVITGTLGGALATRQVVEYADAYTNVANKLRVVTDNQSEFATAQRDVLDIAKETRSNLEGVATLYSRTARQADKLGLSQKEVADFTRATNLALVSYGATSQEAASATLQLAQALASGRLQGEEFRAVAEAAPPILEAIAKETGKTTGELKAMAAAGEITSEVLVRAVLNARDAFQGDFDQTIASVAANLQVVRTNTVEWIGSSETLKTVLSATGESLVTLSNNIPLVTSAITALGVAYATKLLIPLGASTVAFAAQVPVMLAASRTALAYATVMGGVSASQLAAAAATRTLTAGMALLGGPAGLFAIAAGAAVFYFQSLETAAEKTARLAEEGRNLNNDLKLDSLRNVQGLMTVTANKIGTLTEAVAKQREVVKGLEADYIAQVKAARGPGQQVGPPPAALQAARDEAQRLDENLQRAQASFDDLQTKLSGGLLAAIPDQRGGDSAEQNKELTKISENLQRQVALYGQVGEAAKLRYDIENGAFDGAGSQQREAAIALAVTLDKKRADDKAAADKIADDEEAARVTLQNERIVDLQQRRFDAIKLQALAASGDTRGAEVERYQQEQAELEASIARLTEANLLTEALRAGFDDAAEQQKAIHEANLTKITEDETAKRLAAEERVEKAKMALYQGSLDALIGITAQGSAIQRAALVAKAIIAVKEAKVALAKAKAEAVAAGPFPKNLPALAQVAVIGSQVYSAIQAARSGGQAHGGVDNLPRDGTFFLKQGEAVVQPEANADLRAFLASQKSKGGFGGGGSGGITVINNMAAGSPERDVQRQELENGELVIMISDLVDTKISRDLSSGRGTARMLEETYSGLSRRGI